MLSNVGNHVPVNELLEVVGNVASVPPEQIGATAVKVGMIFGFTVIANVAVVAHCPVVGVKV